MHGAAHGSGVYLSPNSNVSFGYTSGSSAIAQKVILASLLEKLLLQLAISYTLYCIIYLCVFLRQQSKLKKECLAGKLNLRCLALCEGWLYY